MGFFLVFLELLADFVTFLVLGNDYLLLELECCLFHAVFEAVNGLSVLLEEHLEALDLFLLLVCLVFKDVHLVPHVVRVGQLA